MKMIKMLSAAKAFLMVLLLSIFQTALWAQDNSGGGGVDIKITKENNNWYAQPWVWIVGGAVFLLLLVALLRNNNNKN